MSKKYQLSKDVLSLFPMNPATLTKKAAAGIIKSKPDPANRTRQLYLVADVEREAPPTEKRVAEFTDAAGEKWVWMQLAVKRYKKHIPTIVRWHSEDKVRIQERWFAGTRGIRSFVSDSDMRTALSSPTPLRVGYLTLDSASKQYKTHEATIRALVRSKKITADWWRTTGRNGWSVRKMIVLAADLDKHFKKLNPERSAWASAIEAGDEYGINPHTLYTWYRFGCAYLPKGKIKTKPFRILKSNGRACNVIHYQRNQLEKLEEILSQPSVREYVAPNGKKYLAWDLAAEKAGVAPIRLWAWSREDASCEHLPATEDLPANRALDSLYMPVRPKRATAKKLSVLAYYDKDIEAIRASIKGEKTAPAVAQSSVAVSEPAPRKIETRGRKKKRGEYERECFALEVSWHTARQHGYTRKEFDVREGLPSKTVTKMLKFCAMRRFRGLN